ncbi:hypothetical protein GJV52_12360 [Neisseria brasiliensis]|uniref:holin n=1 Tax=Neisseria TaxID=482 RepID=UPI000C2739AC|nr:MULTISPECIES: holin [Neisseria]PJO77713.1 hypothetical protein CWC45_09045 [Neisseria sp. N177_16]QGL26249.1 hypothetical protein GJV52_12360 [Neisseria brasiliensis]
MKNFEQPVTAASDIASRYTYGGAGASVVGALLQVDWAMWIGVLVALGGFIVNVFFKMREDRRQTEKHELEKKRLLRSFDAK